MNNSVVSIKVILFLCSMHAFLYSSAQSQTQNWVRWLQPNHQVEFTWATDFFWHHLVEERSIVSEMLRRELLRRLDPAMQVRVRLDAHEASFVITSPKLEIKGCGPDFVSRLPKDLAFIREVDVHRFRDQRQIALRGDPRAVLHEVAEAHLFQLGAQKSHKAQLSIRNIQSLFPESLPWETMGCSEDGVEVRAVNLSQDSDERSLNIKISSSREIRWIPIEPTTLGLIIETAWVLPAKASKDLTYLREILCGGDQSLLRREWLHENPVAFTVVCFASGGWDRVLGVQLEVPPESLPALLKSMTAGVPRLFAAPISHDLIMKTWPELSAQEVIQRGQSLSESLRKVRFTGAVYVGGVGKQPKAPKGWSFY